MAETEKTFVEVPIQKTERQVRYKLTLTEDEAIALFAVTRFIGGDPDTGGRRHMDHINESLQPYVGEKFDDYKHHYYLIGALKFVTSE